MEEQVTPKRPVDLDPLTVNTLWQVSDPDSPRDYARVIHHKGNHLVSTDGFRLFVARTEHVEEGESGKNYDPKIFKDGIGRLVVCRSQLKYPNWAGVLPEGRVKTTIQWKIPGAFKHLKITKKNNAELTVTFDIRNPESARIFLNPPEDYDAQKEIYVFNMTNWAPLAGEDVFINFYGPNRPTIILPGYEDPFAPILKLRWFLVAIPLNFDGESVKNSLKLHYHQKGELVNVVNQ